ncbi:hypothetical protein [Paraburkholderia bannensis]|uniref:hypothetical protein n=1 Tax=Paraburkholderia bannensis TaxID=765414 RepID=UPI002AB5E757|nr:hypothetical protein [Paraburkholderia bannensis]
MARFRKKPVVIEAITFEELVALALTQNGATFVDGVPWSFSYAGQAITHESDDCYLIPTLEGVMRFERGDLLITGVKGEIYPCKADIFAQTYENADGSSLSRYRVKTDGGFEEVEADNWDTTSGMLRLSRGGKVVAVFLCWSGFTTE